MRKATFRILTPSGLSEREFESVVGLDATGSFGIMAGHTDFMTVLNPSILAFTSGGRKWYNAVDGGVLRVERGVVTLATRESVEGEELDALRAVLERRFSAREQKEEAFLDLLGNMEKLLVDRMVKFERGG